MGKYKIPKEYYFRLHHIRPRFKRDTESVLFYISQELTRIGELSSENFIAEVEKSIARYPSNRTKELKTRQNWRTEINTFFGFIKTSNGKMAPSRRAIELAQNQDLAEAFKKWLYFFQYPGGHLNEHSNVELLNNGIEFKPAKTILSVLKKAGEIENNPIGLTKAEVCHCIFNDLRVIRDHESPENTWKRIKTNREFQVTYDTKGDVVRYAGDIIDYMVIANLLFTKDGRYYYLNEQEEEAIQHFLNSSNRFSGYDELVNTGKITTKKILEQKENWISYVNQELDNIDLSTDILSFVTDSESEKTQLKQELSSTFDLFKERLNDKNTKLTTKEIGDIGVALVVEHEKKRLFTSGREDLVHLVKVIPDYLAVGYDINSRETDNQVRFIEVKTTISSKPLTFNTVRMTPNEWNIAESVRDKYHIYRLQLTKDSNKLFILDNPVGLYKNDEITMSPENGAVIRFDTEKVGYFTELLRWEN